jgi:rhamnulokinase
MQPLVDNVVVGRYAIETHFVTSARLESRTSALTRQKRGTSAPVVACDLGATSGRVFAGWFDDAGFRCTEVHRFSNGARMVDGELRWDVDGLWDGIRTGISAARGRGRGTIRSVAVDAWGVDFALLDRGRRLLGNPVSYRDARTRDMVTEAIGRVDERELFAATGNQTLAINTLIQLLAMATTGDPALRDADLLLTIPDLFHHWLCGSEVVERTNATTTECFDQSIGSWAFELLDRFDIPRHIFPPVVEPGTILGTLAGGRLTEHGQAAVVAPAAHDTASAVAAAPGRPGTAFVSAGSWTLVGVERPAPTTVEGALLAGLTNEGGVGGQTLLLSVIPGFWLLELSREAWRRIGDNRELDELLLAAARAEPLRSLFDPNDPSLLDAVDVPTVIRTICRSRGQPEPTEPGEITRAILESLALKAAEAVSSIESVTGELITTIRVIGGGSRNRLYCQWVADASGRAVIAGPAEAAVLGNLAVLAAALGLVGSLADARRIVSDAVRPEIFEPDQDERWLAATERFAVMSTRRPNREQSREVLT